MAKRKHDPEASQDASAQMALEQQPPDEEVPAEDIDAEHEAAEAEEQEPGPEEAPAPDLVPDDPGEVRWLIEYDSETVRLVNEAEEKVERARVAKEDAQAAAKEAKQAWEVRSTDLHELIRERRLNRNPEPLPLFRKPKPEPAVEAPAPAEEPKGTAIAADDAWRRESIVALCDHGVTEATYTKLVEAGIKTLGDLADWTNAGKLLRDIKGVGEAKAEKIVAALDALWEAWQEDREASLRAAREMVAEENGEEALDPDEADDRPADNWRDIPLASLGLEPLIVDLLQAEEITTVGRAANFLGLGGDFADIPGLGGDFAETIKSALARFRAERGGAVLEGFPAELLAPAPAEEPAPAPTKAVRKSRASA